MMILMRAVAIVIALGAGWLMLAPSSLGGQLSFVTTHGTSMQPTFHTGDLAVVVRGDGDYETGEIVAYRSRSLGVVLHRIVAERGDRYVTRGDNNTWLDAEHPTAEDVLGSLLLRIPAAGHLIQATRTPLFWTVVIAAIALTASATKRTRRKKKPLMTTPDRAGARRRETIARTAAGAAAIAAVLSVAGFLVPVTSTAAAAPAGGGAMTWHYTASAPVSVTYPDGRLTTGEPIFLRLIDQLTVQATDTTTGPLPADTFTARVHTGAGWQADVPLAAHPNGARIDLRGLAARLATLTTETGVSQGDTTLTVTARGGASLRFSYDGTQLHPDPTALATSPPPVPGTQQDQPLLASIADPLRSVRWIAAAIAAATSAAAWLLLSRARSASPRVVPGAIGAASIHVPDDRVVVDLADRTEARRIARRAERPLIHHGTGLVVDDGHTVYRYTATED